jgi:hypothetical protein
MVLELRGVACIALEEVTPDRKSLVASRSFGRPVETRRGLEEAVSVYTARAAEKMRRQNLATASLAVWIETNGFKPEERQYSASKSVRLSVATADTGKLIAAATAAPSIIFKQGYRYKKAGVTFLELVPAGRVQSGLFDQPEMRARSAACMQLMSSMRASAAARSASARPASGRSGASGGNSSHRATQQIGTNCCRCRPVATRNTTSLIGFHRPCLTAEERKGPRLTAPVFNVRSADKLCRFWTRRSGSAFREPRLLRANRRSPCRSTNCRSLALKAKFPPGC